MADDRIESLERLAKLRGDGVLSDSEFEAEKARILREADEASLPRDTPPSPEARRVEGKAFDGRWLYASLAVLIIGALFIGFIFLDRRDSPEPVAGLAEISKAVSPTDQRETAEASTPVPEPVSLPQNSGPVAPKIVGEWRMFRTRIREGWGTEPDFAGRYVIIRMGCGAGCTSGIVGDHQTGELYDLGLGGEEQMYLNLDYGNGSNIIKARWDDYETCWAQEFTWTGTSLRPSSQPQARPRGDEPCDMFY